MAKKQSSDDMSIGKFDILATYAYAHALLSGLNDDEAKQRGMVAAIMGAQARLGIRKEHHEHLGWQDHGRTVRGPGKCLSLEMKLTGLRLTPVSESPVHGGSGQVKNSL